MFKVGSIFIPVSNLDESIKWYEHYLGAIFVDRWDFGERGAGFVFKKGDAQLGLVEVDRPQPTEFEVKKGKKNSYYNFLVTDIHKAHHSLYTKGVVVSEISDYSGMGCFEFLDPDGNPFSVVNEVEGSSFHEENLEKLRK
ncbi:VOC family protein [Thalassobacillus pellis]|uniref:VOC family protein n=1 Tax=Thalassobacillus pellis TaxID=748008 RepID=UPI001960BA2C|nr:VOC family protein [Thalassobacillus pellis]MBM7554216.1 catechol 2,3-dioxygenase-like lactoylglutathione lyase family enzyme [Thalassobacillus pellis]